MLARSRVLLGSLLVATITSGSLSSALAQPTPPAPSTGAPTAPAAVPPAPTGPTATPTTTPTTTPTAPMMAPTAMAAPAVVSSSWPLVSFAPDQARASLQRFDQGDKPDGSGWTTVCQGPCAKNLDVRHGYRVGGEGVVPSPWFKLPKSDDAFALKADTGSSGLRTTGIILALAAPLFGAVGATLLATGEDRSAWDNRTYAGGALLVGGVALLVTGLSLIGASTTTTSLERAATPVNARRPRADATF